MVFFLITGLFIDFLEDLGQGFSKYCKGSFLCYLLQIDDGELAAL